MNALTNFRMDIHPWISLGGQVIGTLAAGALVLLYVFQNNLLYIPRPPGFPITPEENPNGCRSPSEWSISGKLMGLYDGNEKDRIKYEDHIIKTIDNEHLHTWLLLQPNSESVPTLIYFHGNAANMGFRLQNAAEMYARVGINILMMDYRGYGKSTGTPTEKGLEIDAEAVLNYCLSHPRLKNSPIVVFGRSLGGAVSIYLAQKFSTQVKAVIIENTFLSVAAMVDVLMPLVSGLKFLVLRIGWNSLNRISSVKQPILFIAGDSDELVPPSHMTRLYEAATASRYRDFFSVFGGQHNDTWVKAGSQYYKRMKAFLESITDPNFKQKNVCETTTATVEEDTSGSSSDVHIKTKPIQALPTMDKGFRVQ